MRKQTQIQKEIDWSFYVKIVISGIFFFFILVIILFGSKAFQPMDEDQVKKDAKPKKTNFKRPLRMKLIVLNTISLFFLLMSIQEYRLNEFMSPFGVDPSKIPSKCRTQQKAYYWITLTCCFFLVVYNFFIHFSVLKKASSTNIIVETTSTTSRDRLSGYVGTANSYIDKLAPKNGGFVVERYPFALEFAFSVLLSFFSVTTYVMFVLINYNVIESEIFKPCFHPQNTDRFYDPFEEQTSDVNY